ncbi:MAG: NAD(P)/FAD-dependent oxidoreductase [Saprospiraceae bacterium]
MSLNINPTSDPRTVIIGGGFAGLELAKKLRKSQHQVVLLDRNNYHNFQPLLYQVATGGLEPDSIAYPLRKVFRGKDTNVAFRMAEVEKITPERNEVLTNRGVLEYDNLVIATGSESKYFDFEPIKDRLLNMKTVPDALNIRSFVLQNFEEAIATDDLNDQNELINIVIIGGGPTGVELAGAFGEMKKYIFPKDYPTLDVSRMQIILLEMGPRLLSAMSKEASEKAAQYLRELSVEVHVGEGASAYEDNVLRTSKGAEINTETVIWAAGVQGNLPEGIDEELVLKGNRLETDEFNRVKSYKNIYALGDAAAIVSKKLPSGHPMLASVAKQQGIHLGENFLRAERGEALKAFKYKDLGTMATVGRNRAVVDMPGFKFQGAFAWLVWMFVHVLLLVGFRSKVTTLWGWVYNYFTYDRSMRLIIRPFEMPKIVFDDKLVESD